MGRARRSLRIPSLICVISLLLTFPQCLLFYLPGVAPEDFQKGDPLSVKVNKLTSTKTQLPYSFYSVPFCHPENIIDSRENLGEVLRGDRIENSYTFKMREPEMCHVVCRLVLDDKTAKEFKEESEDEYRVNMILDNLPLVVPVRRLEQEAAPPAYQQGVYIGVKGQYAGESDVKWASRWDAYLLMADDQIHWFSIVNSLMIVLFLSGMVAMIMLRTLYRDISKYNELETQEEAQEETGWKLVHSDVFRPPSNSDLLCVYVGTGVQFFGMMLVTMMFAVLGFLSFEWGWANDCNAIALQVFMGLFAGYSASRLYKMFKGTEWKRIALRTAFSFQATVFVIFFVLNALIWGQKSSGAVPFGTMFALLCSEDYLWWWRSYLTSGSSALYLFLSATFYFFTKLDITKPVSGILYFGYMLIASYAFFVLTVHVLLDYYDVDKMHKLPNNTAKAPTLFQTTGQASNDEGFLNMTHLGSGSISLGSAVKGATLGSNVVKSGPISNVTIFLSCKLAMLLYHWGGSSDSPSSPSSSPTHAPAPSPGNNNPSSVPSPTPISTAPAPSMPATHRLQPWSCLTLAHRLRQDQAARASPCTSSMVYHLTQCQSPRYPAGASPDADVPAADTPIDASAQDLLVPVPCFRC
ncbi:hypothetical protein HAX54_042295 [Datura stramonium]|uniref:Transmembrane 9 superfamily member n=1 Tax=Datura stramonium TaxID=4076 RepID=A0ABS8SLT9_DATST|nr:hypothetical protein [Datura stramonium]